MNDSFQSDDTDQRFAELIKAEFGDSDGPELPGARVIDPSPPVRPATARQPVIDDFFSLQRALDEAELTDDDVEHWIPPELAAPGRPGPRRLTGALLIVIAVIVGALVLAGWRPALWVSVVTLVCVGGGLIVLASTLPRHGEIDGDGARL
ncbi:hypothetical protein [Brooklawnia sp.]|uniref:hypothetical protein n=1 Tax=Brooklawnia sp. TaxID=2699740 RepID=UPI00311D776D